MKKIPTNSNVFIFDLDGTIADLDKTFIEVLFGMSYIDGIDTEIIENRKYIRFSDCGFITENDESKILKLLRAFHAWENLDVLHNANDFIRRIMEKGCYLIYLTSRPSFLREQTIVWLKKNGFPIPMEDDGYMNSRTILLMDSSLIKKENNMERILNCHSGNNLFYFENDPYFVDIFCKNKINRIFTFDNSFTSEHIFPENVSKIRTFDDVDLEKLLKK